MYGRLYLQHNKQQMKKILPPVLALLLILNLYGLYLLKNSYDSSQEGIRSSILQEIESRRQIEESIKSELDSKRQAKEFILQRDYEKLLEELTQRVSDSQGLIEEYSGASRRQADELAQAISKLSAALEETRGQFIGLSWEIEARKAVESELSMRLRSSLEAAEGNFDQLASSLQGQLGEFGKQLTEYSLRLDELEKGQGEFLNTQEQKKAPDPA